MLPSSSRFACSGVAFGYFSSSATVATTKPGVQKPHMSASTSQKACCTGCSASPFASPSTVRICLPCTSIASVEHEYTVRPSTIIVHAPHVPRSHTRLVPVRSARLRSASSSVTRGSMRRSRRLPLTVSATGTSPGPRTRGPVCVCASISVVAVPTAVARLPTPAVLRKSRRLKAEESSFGGMVKSIDPRRLVQNSIEARLAVLAFARRRPPRNEPDVGPAIEPLHELCITAAPEPFAVNDQVSGVVTLEHVERFVVWKRAHRRPIVAIPRRRKAAVAVDQMLPVERRVVHVGRVGGVERRKLAHHRGRRVPDIAQHVRVHRAPRRRDDRQLGWTRRVLRE